MRRYVYILLFCLLPGSALVAQDLKQALVKMREVYEQSDKLHVVMKIRAFESEAAEAPYYSETAEVKRDGHNYLSRFSGNEMLMNERYFVVVDKSALEIVFNPRSLKAERETFGDLVKMSLDSILTLYTDPRFLGSKDGLDRYEIKQKKGPIGMIGLTIDSRTNMLASMVYHYRDKQYLTIAFDTFDVHPAFTGDTFDEGRYVAKAKGKMMPMPAYKKYTVTDASAKQN